MKKYSWIAQYIGKPYLLGARGPEYFDCYGLVKDIFKTQKGIVLPDWHVTNDNLGEAVREISKHVSDSVFHEYAKPIIDPQDFDIAILKRRRDAYHLGVYIAGGILHIRKDGAGVAHERVSDFSASGQGRVTFYRWSDGAN